MSYTDVIVDFDASLIESNFKTNYILFEEKKPGYNHLCVAEDGQGKQYVETFCYNPTDLYLHNQKIIKVKRVRIYDNYGKMYFKDVLP